MSDYEHSRYVRATDPVETGGAGAFWGLVVVVALGALVLIMAISGAATGPIDASNGTETSVISAAEPEATGTTGAATE